MNIHQSLRHMNEGLKIALGETKIKQVPQSKLKQGLMRFVIMKTDLPTPKAKANTFPEVNMVENNIYPTDIEAEKESLKGAMERFANAQQVEPESALLGKMTKADWARLNYGHMNHHLKQFGA